MNPISPKFALERGRLRDVIATIIINMIALSLLAFAPWSDLRTGAALNFLFALRLPF